LKETIHKYWFLIALIFLLVSGYFASSSLAWLGDWDEIKWVVIFITMFLMSWPLSFSHFNSNLTKPGPAILATILNIGIIPLIAWPLAGLAGSELGPGILIAAATPSTLASAAVWTRRALGNDSVAIIVTIITNASCFFVLPFWIYLQTGSRIDASLLRVTIVKLLFFVVRPMGLAQLARLHRRTADWSSRKKPRLSFFALIGVLFIVFLGAIKMGVRFNATESGAAGFSTINLLTALSIVGMLHITVFWLGIGIARQMNFAREDQIAVGFSGSQKTLMIGLSTAITLGFSMIPIVMFHTLQLLVDAVFAERIRAGELARQESDPRSSRTFSNPELPQETNHEN